MRGAILLLLATSLLFANWQMFSDGVDTYIFNETTGEIYVRYQRGEENYKDYFVKMPVGVLPSQLEPKNSKEGILEMAQPQNSSSEKSTKELQQQAQELQKRLMETIIGD